MTLTDYEQGQADCKKYYEGQAYQSLTRYVRAEDAMRLFWPPVNEMLVQYVAPLPQERKDWIAGFKDAQTHYLEKIDSRRFSGSSD